MATRTNSCAALLVLTVATGALAAPAPAERGSSWGSSSSPSYSSPGGAPAPGGPSAAYRRAQSAANAERSRLSPFAPGSSNFAVDIGQVFLMGDLGSRYSDAIGVRAHYTYGVSDLFGFDTSLGYSDHSDGKYSMSTLLTGLRTNLAWYDKVVPYAVFGLGFYKPSYQLSALTGETGTMSPLLFGIHIGPGVSLEITKSAFFGASFTFHDVFGATKITPAGKTVELGGSYAAFLLHAGMTF